MHVIIIHTTHMSSMNSRYHHITLQSTSLLTYTYSIQTSHGCDQHYIIQRKQIRSEYRQDQQMAERSLVQQTCPSTRDQTAVWNYTTKVNVELQVGDSIGVRV